MILNNEDREQMIENYLNKSIRAFKSCLSLCNSDDLDCDGAANRAYYSMFLAEKALLLTKGISGDTHKHTHMSISKEFVKEGKLPEGTYRYIKMIEGFRDISDYSDKRSVTKNELCESLLGVHSFLTHTKRILLETFPDVIAKCWYDEEKIQPEFERALQSLRLDSEIA